MLVLSWLVASVQSWQQVQWQCLKLNWQGWQTEELLLQPQRVCKSSNKKSSVAIMLLDGSDGTEVQLVRLCNWYVVAFSLIDLTEYSLCQMGVCYSYIMLRRHVSDLQSWAWGQVTVNQIHPDWVWYNWLISRQLLWPASYCSRAARASTKYPW